jgi:hypothetical protein
MPFATIGLVSHVLLFGIRVYIFFRRYWWFQLPPPSGAFLSPFVRFSWGENHPITYSRLLGSQGAGYATQYYHSLIYIILPHSISIVRTSLSSNPQISSRFRISPLTNQWRVQAILIRLMIIIWGTRYHCWVRHCATSREVAGSIPDEVIKYFQLT